jgi:hypothetical protein
LTGEATHWPDRAICVDTQRLEHPKKWRNSAVMTDRWRLINGNALYDMAADPSQKHDVAKKHADVAAQLRSAYETWWADVSKRFGEYTRIVLGSEKANPTRLACHDWHGTKIPWNQVHIRRGMEGNGFWAVQVDRDGTYEFALQRWPVEVNEPITAAINGGKAIRATKARLKIADVDLTQPVAKDAAAVTFKVQLKAGKTRLQTWFDDDKGTSSGAYYVYVKRTS